MEDPGLSCEEEEENQEPQEACEEEKQEVVQIDVSQIKTQNIADVFTPVPYTVHRYVPPTTYSNMMSKRI